MDTSLPPLPLPPGIQSQYVDCSDSVGLTFHTLSAGQPASVQHHKPLLLLVHGFPDLAFSWRHVLIPLSQIVLPDRAPSGYHVVAYDQRGYGRTQGWQHEANSPAVDLKTTGFRSMQLVRDALALVSTLGYATVDCIVGHDFGAVTAGLCALTRGDVFRSLVLMSHPWKGTPPRPLSAHEKAKGVEGSVDMQRDPDVQLSLANYDPPLKHYKWYSSTAPAAKDWEEASPLGMHSFLRGYFHLKSASWPGNAQIAPLKSWTADQLARMPNYYIMPLDKTMPQTVADELAVIQQRDPAEMQKTESWLPEDELSVYVEEWRRTGFQGGLNWYRCMTSPDLNKDDMALFAGRKIDVPLCFISGQSDWGNWQEPGALRGMQNNKSCSDCRFVEIIQDAGHWVQQEEPRSVVKGVARFLRTL